MVSVSSRKAGNLPVEVTGFVGRRQAVAEVKRLLSVSRIVTLTGVGGVGKSRLALRVARDVRRAFPDGVWLVELAKLQDPLLLDHVVFEALGQRNQSTRELDSVLVEYLADKRLLLVLDNCEHLVDACSRLVSRLVSVAPEVRFLVTSRQCLRVVGEHIWPVPPMSLPHVNGADGLAANRIRRSVRYEALVLFEKRAAAVSPGFVVSGNNDVAVTRLCRRLDGLPLAIELAAARVRVLSVEEILARLEDRYRFLTADGCGVLSRHQTLRAAVGWSFDLCSEQEKSLWMALSVFAGGFDLEAAESVCAQEGMSEHDVFTGVAGLLEKSVLAREDAPGPRARYRMLETIRQYGRDRLVASGRQAAVRRRHRDHYLRFAEQVEDGCFGPDQKEWSVRLRLDRSNLWAALEYCLTEPGESQVGLRMVTALWFNWIPCGFLRDGRFWLDRALSRDNEPSPERAWALCIEAFVAELQGDIPSSLMLLDEGRAMARRCGKEWMLPYATEFAGLAHLFKGDLPPAADLLDRSLAQHRASGELNCLVAAAYPKRSWVAACMGDLDLAVELFHECQAICAPHGERWATSWAAWVLAFARLTHGDLPEARALVHEALRVKLDLGDLLGLPCGLDLMAVIKAAEGDVTRAARLFGASQALWNPIGNPRFGFDALTGLCLQGETQARQALGDSAYDAAYQQGSQLTIDQAVAEAIDDENTKPAASGRTVPQSLLTRRERETATLVAKGLTNKDIADQLVIAQRTAESHVEHILVKLGFTSRAQIAAWVAEQAPVDNPARPNGPTA